MREGGGGGGGAGGIVRGLLVSGCDRGVEGAVELRAGEERGEG